MKTIALASQLVAIALMAGGLAIAQEAPSQPAAQESTAPAEPAATDATAQAATEAATEAAPTAPAESEAAAPATSDAATAPAAGTGSGTGTVIFFRPSKFVGAAVGFKVRENGKELGKLRNGKYFVLAVEPGVHQYEVQGEAKDVLTLEVEAGETYYVQGLLGVGIVAGRPNLTPSDASTFEALKPKLKEVAPLAGDDGQD